MQETTTTEQQSGPQLQVADLTVALDAIQLAAARGAYRANEFVTIGGCFDRIYAFLVSIGAVAQPAAEQPAPEGE